MSLFWLLLVAAIVALVVRLFPRGESRPDGGPAGERPEEILDRRLAMGEIDPETYDRLREVLRGGPAGQRR